MNGRFRIFLLSSALALSGCGSLGIGGDAGAAAIKEFVKGLKDVGCKPPKQAEYEKSGDDVRVSFSCPESKQVSQ